MVGAKHNHFQILIRQKTKPIKVFQQMEESLFLQLVIDGNLAMEVVIYTCQNSKMVHGPQS